MIFNSYPFIIFFIVIYFTYWGLKNKNHQNLLLLFGSYFFYGWWDYKFLLLIFISTLSDFVISILIDKSNKKIKNKILLFLSIFINLGILIIFKYYDFFVREFTNIFNLEISDFNILNLVLPIGISFYTFQTMSYTIDVYKKQISSHKNIVEFAIFVNYFPQLVAGPIETAKNLIPQISNPRRFIYSQQVQGFRLILYGFFKKIVVADSLAPFVDTIFSNYETLNGGTLALGVFYFTFQIYCDFSGYSDIAIGISKTLGIELKSNFKFPYFSKNISEFWNRWHISLSSWFKNYVYFPLGGSRKNLSSSILNVMIIFILSGLWHGANLTFIFWGLIHGIIYIPYFISKRFNYKLNLINIKFLNILTTFILINITWIFFRSEIIAMAFDIIKSIFIDFGLPTSSRSGLKYILLLMPFEFLFMKNERLLFNFNNKKIRWATYVLIIFLIFRYANSNQTFIYFNF